MDQEFWNLLTGYGTKIHLCRHVCLNISRQGTADDSFYLLEDGICALMGITKKGEETVYLYLDPPRIVGFNQLLMTNSADPPQEFTIITKTACTLYRIRFSAFQDLMANNPEFNAFLIRTLADNFYEVLVHFHRRLEESAVAGLSRLLLDVAQNKEGELVVPKFFTYAELAKYLGSHPVTVSRIMAKLKQLGYIVKDHDGIILNDPAALKELVNGDRDLNY